MALQPGSRLANIALTGRILGSLFYYEPDRDEVQDLLIMLQDARWLQEWPWHHPDLPEVAWQLCCGELEGNETLVQAYQWLFIGPWALPVPPWGSVWLDSESVLFGESTQALCKWMRRHHIISAARPGEPDDHIGLLLLLSAWLAEQERLVCLDELLAWHLLPWSGRFLDQLIEYAGHPFYAGLGTLARLTLQEWQRDLLIPVAQKPLYR